MIYSAALSGKSYVSKCEKHLLILHGQPSAAHVQFLIGKNARIYMQPHNLISGQQPSAVGP